MKILLLGGTGQVGWELLRTLAPLGTIVAPGRADADLTRPESLRTLVHAVGPSLIVNAAAYTAVDQAKSEPDVALAVNGTAPGVLAEEAAKRGVPLVHYSTDYVFDGTKSGMYLETDPTRPLNVYGSSKLAGEQVVAASGADHLILRTSWVYGARGRNFLRTILRLAHERERLSVVDDQIGAPTWSRLIAEATAQILVQHRNGEAFRFGTAMGLYHLAASGETSWHGFAQAILGLDPQASGQKVRGVDPISTEAYGSLELRPANSRLDTRRLQTAFGTRLPDWQESLKLVMEEVGS